MLDVSALTNTLLPLLTALLLGGLIGLDREIRGRWAGLRTHILVALGAALLMAAGKAMEGTIQLGHVINGIAAGIGFIGAGTILKRSEKMEIKGLTTASSIWLAAAVGTAAGLQLYLLAVSGTIIAFLVLRVIGMMEQPPNKGERQHKTTEHTQPNTVPTEPVLSH
jgi:putative Mg2+ transporter-C (MgtC) family protein